MRTAERARAVVPPGKGGPRAGPRSGVARRERVARRPALPDEVERLLREDIAGGALAPGAKLPTEKALSESFGVSRAVVREAVSRLKADGLVTSRQGSGAYVSSSGSANAFRIGDADLDDQAELAPLIEFLVAIDVAVAEHAARRRTERHLQAITRALQAMADAVARGESGVDEDLQFHRAIADASGNPFFRDMTEFLEARVRKFIRTARMDAARSAALTRLVHGEHTALRDAIAARDPEGARHTAEQHLRNAARRLRLYRGER